MASNAHFVGTPELASSADKLSAAGKVAGLGNVPQIHVVLSGDAQCVNPGGNEPQAANKQSCSQEGDFPVQNGHANFQIGLTAEFKPDCSPPMTVEWSNLKVDVTADDGTSMQYLK